MSPQHPEKTLGSGSLNNQIIARAAEVGLPKIPIQWLKPGNRKGSKNFRISNIQPAFVGRRLWLWHAIAGYDILVKQLCRFPRIKHDDFADCLGWVVEAPTGYELETPPQRESTGHWLARLNGCEPENPNYPDSGGGSGVGLRRVSRWQ
jgi:hypothetical protein